MCGYHVKVEPRFSLKADWTLDPMTAEVVVKSATNVLQHGFEFCCWCATTRRSTLPRCTADQLCRCVISGVISRAPLSFTCRPIVVTVFETRRQSLIWSRSHHKQRRRALKELMTGQSGVSDKCSLILAGSHAVQLVMHATRRWSRCRADEVAASVETEQGRKALEATQ